MKHIIIILTTLLLIQCTTKQSESPPNILFIFSDDHAVQSISAYGSKINTTPNIDRIANEGLIFHRATVCNSICAPSRAAILTGKHSHKNGKMTNLDIFDSTQTTFPGLMKENGYRTALIGKWHLKSSPKGFDYYDVLQGQGAYYNPDFINEDGKRRVIGYNTDIVTDLALDWLEEYEQEKPFMLMCQYKAPHRTWAPGPDHLDMYADDVIPEPATLFDDFTGRSDFVKENEMMIADHLMYDYDLKIAGAEEKDALGRNMKNGELRRMTDEQRKAWDAAYVPRNQVFRETNPQGDDLVRWKYQRYIKDYLRCIASVDDNIGRLLEYLEESGISENTLVVYSSDQGFYLGEHGWYDKRWMYEESLRTPLVMKWPGKIPAGGEIYQLVQNIDYGPTFLDVAGIELPTKMQGKSLAPFFENTVVDDWRKSVYYHYYEEGEHNVPMHEGIRTDRFKLINFYSRGTWEMYDLQNDPNEMNSIWDTENYNQIRDSILIDFEKLKEEYEVPSR